MKNLSCIFHFDVQILARLELLRRLYGFSDYDGVLQIAVGEFYRKMKGEIVNAELERK